ncbi:MAG: hypothetical protein AAB546_03035 [Patescibacteria group bacterium]
MLEMCGRPYQNSEGYRILCNLLEDFEEQDVKIPAPICIACMNLAPDLLLSELEEFVDQEPFASVEEAARINIQKEFVIDSLLGANKGVFWVYRNLATCRSREAQTSGERKFWEVVASGISLERYQDSANLES